MPTLATASPKYRSALDLIKFFEGSNKVRTDAYLDSEGIPTIGWGATSYQDGRPVRIGDRVSPQQADQLLKFHMDQTVSNLTKLPNWKNYSSSQQDALRSFAYNAGPNFLDSPGFKTMADAVRAGNTKAISDAFGLYTNGGNAGLKARRDAERALFNSTPRVNTPDQQDLYNPNSRGKQGPTFNPASWFNTKKMPRSYKKNASTDVVVSEGSGMPKGKADKRSIRAMQAVQGAAQAMNPYMMPQITKTPTINNPYNWASTAPAANSWVAGFKMPSLM